MSKDKLPYTMVQVDAALEAIIGSKVFEAYKSGSLYNRPMLCDRCATMAWVEMRPEDEHSAILRSAIEDLRTYGDV